MTKPRSKLTPRIQWLASHFILITVVVYVFVFLFRYDQSWMQSEAVRSRKHLVEITGGSLCFRDIIASLDYNTFEYVPRITRPLSNLLDVINIKFRIWLWKYWVPHPAASLTLIFSFLLSPLLLFGLLRNIGLGGRLSLTCTALYLASPGFLSPLVMHFRSAKAMTNFSILLCLYLASQLSLESSRAPVSRWRFFAFLVVVFCSFFWDETALLIFPAVALFFPDLFRARRRLLLWAMLPVGVLFCYLWLFPLMIAVAGYKKPDLFEYHAISDPSFPGVLPFLNHLIVNTRLLFGDSLGLVSPERLPNTFAKILFWVNVALVAAIGGQLIRKLLDKNSAHQKGRARLIAKSAVFLLFLCFVHSYLLCSAYYQIRGLYWLGSYWSVFFVLFVALVLDWLRKPALAICFLVVIGISASYLFVHTNAAYRHCLRTEGCSGPEIWGALRFTTLLPPSDFNYALTRYLWERSRAGGFKRTIILPHDLPDLDYLAHELGIKIVHRKVTKEGGAY